MIYAVLHIVGYCLFHLSFVSVSNLICAYYHHWYLTDLMWKSCDWPSHHLPAAVSFFSCFEKCYINGLMQERRNSSASAMELRLSCTNPSTWLLAPCFMWEAQSLLSSTLCELRMLLLGFTALILHSLWSCCYELFIDHQTLFCWTHHGFLMPYGIINYLDEPLSCYHGLSLSHCLNHWEGPWRYLKSKFKYFHLGIFFC